MVYKLETFTFPTKSLYVKDLEFYSSTLAITHLDRKTLCLELQNVLAKFSIYAKPEASEIICIETEENSNTAELSIGYRPYLFDFLNDMKSKYELIVYTRLNWRFAKPVVDAIQRKKKYFSHVCCEELCVFANLPCAVKCIDFLCTNRTSSDIIVVDTQAATLPFNRENLVYVGSYEERNSEDQELIKLAKFLDVIYKKKM
eukprot:TRINITY_DN2476_c0_g2_i2.p1 TRINITY_DN2476_c0_g2~~TRINITY_DN2476_c0_g2_i2.p1  ORF type:complete len:201 (-),score=23.36 TRINITY_DN2476_c0_g2_i2:115-717(-)